VFLGTLGGDLLSRGRTEDAMSTLWIKVPKPGRRRRHEPEDYVVQRPPTPAERRRHEAELRQRDPFPRDPDVRSAGTKRPPTPDSLTAAPTQAGPRDWAAIKILFLDDHNLQVYVDGKPQEPVNYAVFDFADGRTTNPRRAWTVLKAFAEKRGTIPTTAESRPRIEKDVQQIRKILRKRFSLSSDPVRFTGTGYSTAFTIGKSTAYGS
jgi:hypothetical protein